MKALAKCFETLGVYLELGETVISRVDVIAVGCISSNELLDLLRGLFLTGKDVNALDLFHVLIKKIDTVLLLAKAV